MLLLNARSIHNKTSLTCDKDERAALANIFETWMNIEEDCLLGNLPAWGSAVISSYGQEMEARTSFCNLGHSGDI